MKKVLFICTGNTCRSPMAAALFNEYARLHGLDMTADSAGVAAADGSPASENSVEALKEVGIDLSAHRSKCVSRALLDAADLIVCMSESHANLLRQAGYSPIVFGGGIPDPYGFPLDEYRRCRDIMMSEIPDIAARLQ